MNLITIDPGKHKCGVCTWRDGTLLSAHLLDSLGELPGFRVNDLYTVGAHLVICELMQVYPGGRHAADLVDVSIAGAILCAEYARVGKVQWTHPRAWKGTIPKDVHHKRLYAGMTQNERTMIESVDCPRSVLHNVVDAYGIGKWFWAKQGK